MGVTQSYFNSFNENLSKVVQKSRRLVGLCFRTLQSRDPSFMMRIYKIYILPVLNYASSVWSPHYCQDIEILEAVQRRFTKRLVGQRNCSYRERLRNLSLLSLESQRIETDLITAYKPIHGMMGISVEEAGLELSASNTRGDGTRMQQKFAASVSVASRFKFRAVAE